MKPTRPPLVDADKSAATPPSRPDRGGTSSTPLSRSQASTPRKPISLKEMLEERRTEEREIALQDGVKVLGGATHLRAPAHSDGEPLCPRAHP